MRLPSRYETQWRAPFMARVMEQLVPGMSILDVGAGAAPILPVESRPEGVAYVGLDIERAELERAPRDSYTEMFEQDVSVFESGLENRFDLILSWQVLEHVQRLPEAIDNCHRYLRPGGHLIAQMSGAYTMSAAINRALPRGLSRWLLHHLNKRPYESIFDAYYDRCWYSALEEVFGNWSRCEITPLYHGAEYFRFSLLLQRAYLIYENWAAEQRMRSLATHYIVVADR